MTDNLTDEQLVSIVRESDKEKYAEIVHRYETKLSHYLRKFIPDDDQRQDVLQEVFIKAYRYLFWFDVKKRFSPWIYRIAHNEAINYIKRYKKKTISLEPEELHIMDDSIDHPKQIDNNILKDQLEKALGHLKDKYREVLILYYFEEKSYEEISDILQCPKNSVGVMIKRAKEQLKKSLEKLYGGKY